MTDDVSAPLTFDGWISNASPKGGGTHFHVRGEQGKGWRIVGVYVHSDPAVTQSDLRDVPVRTMDLYLNLRHGLPEGSTLRVLDEIASLNSRGPMVYAPAAADMSIADLESRARDAASTKKPRPSARKRERLVRPDGTDPDGFYSRVAAAYGEYVVNSRAPAADIAREAGVPVSTAHRWIREARRRGFLVAGSRGKAG